MVHGYFLSSLILFSSLLFTHLSFISLKYVSGIIKIPFVSTFFMFKYFVFAYIGSVLLNVFYFDYTAPLYSRPDLLILMWIYASCGLFLLPLGMLIANYTLQYKSIKSTKRLLSKDIIITNQDRSLVLFLFLNILFIISIIVLFLYINKLNMIPLTGAIKGLDPAYLALLRSEATNSFDGKYYRYMMFVKDLPLLLILVVFFFKTSGFKWKLFFYILFIYNIYVNIMDLQKAPVIQLLLILMLAKFYIDRKVSKKVFVVIGVLSVILLMIMYKFFMMGSVERDFLEFLYAPMNRLFLGQIKPFYYWLEFQENIGYLYGKAFPNPGGIFPFDFRNIPIEVMEFAHPEIVSTGRIGTMPTIFYADWFINFGPLLAGFSMLLLGFILQITDIVFIRFLIKYKSVFISALFIYIINYFGKFSGTTFTSIMFDTHLIFPVVVLGLIIIVKSSIYRRKMI